MSAGKPAKGFTIIELMIGIAVLGVLVSLGVPSMRNLIISQRVKTAASDLHLSLTLARSEAIKRNATVQVEPVDTSDWSKGWSVKAASGAETLSTQQSYPNVAFTGPAAAVSYVGTGRMSGAAVSFFIRSPDATHIAPRCVQVEPSGRPSVRVDKDGNHTDGTCG